VTQADIDTTVADYLPLAGGTMTGSIVVPDGTAAAPSLKFNDATGLFQPAANTWAVSTAGVERMRVDAKGHVGLGVTPATTVGVWVGQKLAGSSVASIMTTAPIESAVTTASYNRVRFNLLAGAAVGTLRGYSVDSQSFAGSATDVCGYYCETLPAGTGQTWAFYAATNKSYFGGQVQTGLGTAVAPSVSIFGDEDTGTWSPAANTWAVSTGGVERLRVKSTGSVRYVPLATAPANPEEGEVYYDSTIKKLRLYDGTDWLDLGKPGT
jgi:hypothetical protein